MRILLSIVWLALAGAFFTLGWQLWGQANAPLPEFEASQPKVEFSGEKFRFEIGVDAPVPARLTLRAWHDRPPERESGLRIAEPAVIENTPPATIETVQPLARQAADAVRPVDAG